MLLNHFSRLRNLCTVVSGKLWYIFVSGYHLGLNLVVANNLIRIYGRRVVIVSENQFSFYVWLLVRFSISLFSHS